MTLDEVRARLADALDPLKNPTKGDALDACEQLLQELLEQKAVIVAVSAEVLSAARK